VQPLTPELVRRTLEALATMWRSSGPAGDAGVGNVAAAVAEFLESRRLPNVCSIGHPVIVRLRCWMRVGWRFCGRG